MTGTARLVRRPRCTPFKRFWAIPALVRSPIIPRSSSANRGAMCTKVRPIAVLVSMLPCTPLAPRNCLDRPHRSIVAAHVAVMASRLQESSAGSPRSGRAVGERASSDPIESGAVAMELHALEFVGERAETFVRGRAAGVEAARRHGPVPDRVADAIATIITGDPAVRAAG